MNKFNELYETTIKGRVILYHGDNHGTIETKAELMNNGNNQEGIGIYFSPDINVAKHYGKKIVKVQIKKELFVESRSYVKDNKEIYDKLEQFLVKLFPYEKEAFFYEYTNYFSDVTDPDKITAEHIKHLADMYVNEEIRNLQINLTEIVGVENFVKEWNKLYKNIYGTYDNGTEFYAIIKTGIRTERISD